MADVAKICRYCGHAVPNEKEIRAKVINDFIRALNDSDRYVAEQITHCLNGNIYPENEVFVVDEVYKIAEEMRGERYDN